MKTIVQSALISGAIALTAMIWPSMSHADGYYRHYREPIVIIIDKTPAYGRHSRHFHHHKYRHPSHHHRRHFSDHRHYDHHYKHKHGHHSGRGHDSGHFGFYIRF